MNADKSLYMKEFMELRNYLGKVTNVSHEHILFTNLYNEFLPSKTKKKVKDVVDSIEEKTILIRNTKKNIMTKDDKDDKDDKGALPIEDPIEDIIDVDPIEESIEESIDEPIDEPIDVDPIEEEDVVEEDVEEDVVEEVINKKNDPIINDPIIDVMDNGGEVKKIIINPNYVVPDK